LAKITDERRPLADLKQHPKNYNVHRGPHIERMAAKVRLNAFTSPFIIRPDGTILGGHLRRLSLLHLKNESYPEPQGVDPGWVVPCRVFEGTETQELALLAGDNIHPSEIEFDNEALSSLLAELQADDALEGSGYDAEALDRLIGELAEQGGGGAGESGLLDGANVDEIPEQVEERCQAGDLWSLGNHRLICGDCTDAETVARLMDGARAELCLTDPPYGVGLGYASTDDTEANLDGLIAGFLPIARDVADVVFITPGNKNQWAYPRPDWCMAWFCAAGAGMNSHGFTCWQPVMVYGKDPYLAKCKGSRPDALCKTETAPDLSHPCPKPVAVWEWWMERGSLSPGDNVYDPFLGSGTTLIAAESLGRRCFGLEIEPRYCDVILARWERATGKTAELLERAE
jgi:hypothetical protein